MRILAGRQCLYVYLKRKGRPLCLFWALEHEGKPHDILIFAKNFSPFFVGSTLTLFQRVCSFQDHIFIIEIVLNSKGPFTPDIY